MRPVLAALLSLLLLAASAPPAADAAGASCSKATLAIAVDAGHGPNVPGATSARGVPEYDFNLRLAKEVVAALSAAGFPKAFLLDPKGMDLPPAARAARANAAKAGPLMGTSWTPSDSMRCWSRCSKAMARTLCAAMVA